MERNLSIGTSLATTWGAMESTVALVMDMNYSPMEATSWHLRIRRELEE